MKTFITDNKKYENISGWKKVYIYVSEEVFDYVFSKNMRIYQVKKKVYIYVSNEVVDNVFLTVTITTFRCAIPHNVLLLTESLRSNCLLQIL